MKAIKIKMKDGKEQSKNTMDIDSIYINGKGNERFFKVGTIYDFIEHEPGLIQIDIYPYEDLLPIIIDNKKIVRCSLNSTNNDKLLLLPRENV